MPDRIPFTGYPLDRADAVRRQPEALAAHAAAPSTRVVVFWRGKPLLRTVDGVFGPAWQPAPGIEAPLVRLFLGLDTNGHATFAACADPAAEAPRLEHGRFEDLRTSAGRLDLDAASLLATARSTFAWHRSHRFCSACGASTSVVDAGWKRHCDACDTEHFPRVNPVVIAIITHEDRVLLGRAPHWPGRAFSCLAGFMEPGETLGDATRREAMEEAGVQVGDVTYLFAQPWPFPSSLMFGVCAEALDDEVTVDGVELSEARWFTRDEVQSMFAGTHPHALPPFPIAVAHHLLRWWLSETERP